MRAKVLTKLVHHSQVCEWWCLGLSVTRLVNAAILAAWIPVSVEDRTNASSPWELPQALLFGKESARQTAATSNSTP